MSILNDHPTEAECSLRMEAVRKDLNGLRKRLGEMTQGQEESNQGLKRQLDEHEKRAAKHTADLDHGRQEIVHLREAGVASLEKLEKLLGTGLQERLRPFFDEHLRNVEERLDDLRKIATGTEDLNRQAQAAQQRCEATEKAMQASAEEVRVHNS